MGKCLGVLFCLNAVLQFVSIWTGWAFVIDAANVYHSGVLNAFTRICSILTSCYLIYSFYRFSRAYRNGNAVILLSIIVLISFGVVVHIIYPDLQVMYVRKLKNEMAAWKGIHIENLSASVGTARMDETETGTLMEQVVRAADARMYEEKAEYYKLHGRNLT